MWLADRGPNAGRLVGGGNGPETQPPVWRFGRLSQCLTALYRHLASRCILSHKNMIYYSNYPIQTGPECFDDGICGAAQASIHLDRYPLWLISAIQPPISSSADSSFENQLCLVHFLVEILVSPEIGAYLQEKGFIVRTRYERD